jgi:phage gpG-like protein
VIDVRLELDARSALAGLDRMAKAGNAPTKAFRALRPVMRADQREHARRAEGPSGKWPARKTRITSRSRGSNGRYLSARRRSRGLARRPLGRLTTAVTYTASKDGLIGRSLVQWSGAHQWGGRVGNGADLPARPFLWLSDKLVEQSTRMLADHVRRAFEEG